MPGPELTLWVMAYDRVTGRRAAFTICPERLAPYHREAYLAVAQRHLSSRKLQALF